MRRPSVLAVLLAIAFASTARAARPSLAYEVVVEEPKALADVLRDRLGYGYACMAVARSVGMKLSPNVAVIVGLEKGAADPAQRPRLVAFGQRTAPGELVEDRRQSLAQTLEHPRVLLTRPKRKRASARIFAD